MANYSYFVYAANYFLIQVKKSGRYQGALVTHTLVQHMIDTESAITVPCLMDDDDFPKGALALSATAVSSTIALVLVLELLTSLY